jgi:[protein-PII] uridylyltransferase
VNTLLDQNIAGLFASKNSILAFKELIKRQNEELKQLFNPHQSIAHLLSSKADFIDQILMAAWQHFLTANASELALCAVGGYGRRELFPYSDIDILILLDQAETPLYKTALSNFCNFIWDIGLKPGLSVRTVTECIEVIKEDQTVMTSLLEMRLIQGNRTLFNHIQQIINSDYPENPDPVWPSEQFFAAKMQEQRLRYFKYHETAYNLEPNTKEGPGGLRDLQVIAWVFKRHYHSSTLEELVEYDFILPSEYAELIAARDVLWCVRYALHILTNRCEDRLLFDYQHDLAVQFGFTAGDYNQNTEQFMQFYFKTVVGLERLNEMLLQLFSERLIAHHKIELEDINEHFVAINGYLEAKTDQIFQQQPLLLLELFLLLQQNLHLKGIRATTVRLIRKNLALIDDAFRYNKDANRLFMAILRQPHGVTHLLRRMNRYGLLAAYLPSFANIVARMQYDLFHVYTVDEHTLFVIGNLRRFSLAKYKHELPFCHDVFALVSKPEVLYIAALFHDIAKGMGGDHSCLGEEMAREFCFQHELSSRDAKLVTWLVRNHLLMSMTAQRKDISDPEVIYEFASQVGNIEYLHHIYLLTVADIRATSPSLWNSWKDALLQELYNLSLRALRRGLQNPITISQRLAENKKEAREELLKQGLAPEVIDASWQHTSDDYFLRYAADEIVWHTLAIASCTEQCLPLVLLRSQTQRGSAEVFVYAKNEAAIFSISTETLDQLGLTILDARIITTADQYVLNSFQILEQSGLAINDTVRKEHICIALRNNLLKHEVKVQKNIHRQSRQAKHFPIATKVFFHADSLNRTVIELITTDRAGLLSTIGQVFIKLAIQLHDAKITTIGSRAEDIFYVTDKKGQLLTEQQKQQLQAALLDNLNQK